MHNQRSRDAAFVIEMFVAPQRRVGERRPALALKHFRPNGAGRIAVELPLGPLSAFAPLSDRKRISVLSSIFRFCKESTSRPTAVSMCDTTAA